MFAIGKHYAGHDGRTTELVDCLSALTIASTERYLRPKVAWRPEVVLQIAALSPHAQPQDTRIGRAVFMAKGANKERDPLSYRVLLMLSTLYRT